MMKRLFVPCFYLWCFTIPVFAATQIVPANDDGSTFSLAIKPANKKKLVAKEKKVAPAPKEINLLLDDMHFEITRQQEDDWFNKIFHEKNNSSTSPLYTLNLTPNKSDINSVTVNFFPVAFKQTESTNPFAPVQPMLSIFTINFF